MVLTTNRDVSTIPPDLTKRMVTCHISTSPSPKIALISMRRQRDFPDLLARSAEILRNLFSETLDTVPE